MSEREAQPVSDAEQFAAEAEDLIRSVGMDSGLMDMGAASCIYSEGCEGVTVSDLHKILQAATAHERARITAMIGDGLVDGQALKRAIWG